MPENQSPSRATAEPITAVVAERVRELRERANLSQAELADEMTKRGVPWKRATVVNLEKRAPSSRGGGGGRDSVSVQELLALALVLKVPPAILLADPRSDAQLLIGDRSTEAWPALFWLCGLAALDDQPTNGEFSRAAWLIELGHEFMVRCDRLTQIERGYRVNPDGTLFHDEQGHLVVDDERARELTDAKHREHLSKIRSVLLQMAARGAGLPPVPQHVLRRAEELGEDLPGVEA